MLFNKKYMKQMLNLHLVYIAALIVVSLLQQVSDVSKMKTESMLWWKYCEMLMHQFLYTLSEDSSFILTALTVILLH